MRLHVNTLIILEEEFGTFEIGPMQPYCREPYYANERGLALKFGFWKEIDVERLQRMLRSLSVNQSIYVHQNLVDDDEECGELYNYIITKNKIS